MIFEYDLVVPANTLELAPVSEELMLSHGIIHKLELAFPPGCHNAVKVILRRGLHQAFPLNPDGQFKGNAITLSYSTWYELEEAPYSLDVYAWSPGATYSHTITIRLGVERREILFPGGQALGIIERLGQLLFGRR